MQALQGGRVCLVLLLAGLGGCSMFEEGAGPLEPPGAVQTSRGGLVAGGAELVRDIQPTRPPQVTKSDPQNFMFVGNTLFFSAADPLHGVELWKSDGTAEGTRLVRDIRPGTSNSSPTDFLDVNGVLFFRADDGSSGGELWTSDGTAEGTRLVADLLPGASGSIPRRLGALGDVFLFAANDRVHGTALWRSDGTAQGTRPVRTLTPNTGLTTMSYFLVHQGVLYFPANDGVNGTELWRTDGTEEGTWMVRDIAPGSASSLPGHPKSMGGMIYFLANDGVNGRELWKTDGTQAGTQLVKDLRTGTTDGLISDLTVVGNLLFFSMDDGVSGRELWRSDGTAAGTWRVKDLWPGTLAGLPFSDALAGLGGVLYFIGNDGTSGWDLWRSDGSVAGTWRVKDLAIPNHEGVENFTATRSALSFIVWSTAGGVSRTLYTSNGTEEGTVPLRALVPKSSDGSSSNFKSMASLEDTLYVSADDGVHGRELWRIDGTETGTRLVHDIARGYFGSFPKAPMDVGGIAVFTADDGTHGRELWRSDGTAAGTTMLRDIHPSGGSEFWYPTLLDGVLYFSATEPLSGTELWRTDGTADGTRMVVDAAPGTKSLNPTLPRRVGDKLLFVGYSEANGHELWRSDGTAAGTALLRDILSGTGAGVPSWQQRVAVGNGVLYFQADDGVSGFEPWRSDGTAAGTERIIDLVPGSGRTNVHRLVAMDGGLVFVASDAAGKWGLWWSDGLAGGTTRLLPVTIPVSSFDPTIVYAELFSAGKTVFVNLDMGATTLWRTDGTEAGTVPVGQGLFTNPSAMMVVGNLLFFRAYTPTRGYELWRTDGTETGTFPVKDLTPGPTGGLDESPMLLALEPEGLLVFRASDGVHGVELWVSDGTEAGTSMLADVAPGALSSMPQEAGRVGGWIYFSADDGTQNREPWRIRIPVPAAPDTTPPTLTCPDAVTAEATQPDGVTVVYPAASANDDSAEAPSVTYSQVSGTVFALGTTTVTVTAKDAAGNTSTCSFPVTVRDTTAPVLTCPEDVTQEASDSTGGSVSYPAATATDAVTAAPEVTYSHASGSTFPVGDTAVTVTARDTAGNTSTCLFQVRVKDSTAPTLVCPEPVTVEALGSEGTPVTYAAETSDAVSAVTVTYSTQPGTVFALGTTTVTVTAKDAADNASTCLFPVTVKDTTAPVVTCPANVRVETREASSLVVEFPAATATDAVTTAPRVTYSQASGSTFPSGTTSVTTTATDEAGNAATCSFQVTVSVVQEPEPTGPDPIQVPISTGYGCGTTGSAGAGLGWMMLLLAWGAVRRPVRSRG